MARRLRIGWPRNYSATITAGVYSVSGQSATLTYTPAADTTPNAFTFVDQTGVATSTVITSAPITISGLSTGTSITLNASGGTIDKNGDANFLGSQIVQNGDTVRARVTSSASGGVATNCTVVASPSGVQDTFTATTSGAASGFTFAPGWSGSGNFADGQIVTLTRAAGGLSIPTDPRPDLWVPLESDLNRDATYSKASITLVAQENAAIQSSVKPTNAAGALRQQFLATGGSGTQPGASPGNPDANFFDNDPISTISSVCYVSMKRYRDYDATNLNGKNFRIWDAAANVTDTYIKDGFNNAAITEGSAFDAYQQHGGLTPFFTWPFIRNAWWTEEFIFKESTLDTQNGVIDSSRNGGWAYGATNRSFITLSTGHTGVKVRLYFSQYSNPGSTGPPNNSNEYMAHLYINGTSRFRVVVSNESTYRTTASTTDVGITREVQLPVQNSGSATGVQICLRAGSLSLSGKYMYLIDANEVDYYVGQFN